MRLDLDGKQINFTGETIADLISSLKQPIQAGFVVALNEIIITKSKWHSSRLRENDSVLIIHPLKEDNVFFLPKLLLLLTK